MEKDTIGVDIGGTKCWIGRINPVGQVLEAREFLSRKERGFQSFMQELIYHLELLKKPSTQAIGVGIAGQVSREDGSISFAPNLEWRNVPLHADLRQALNLPVRVLNDVHAAAFGEWSCGAGKGEKDLVALFIGTGVGGAVLSDGRWLLGADGCAAELGHLCICMGGRLCGCGNLGCLEAYLGGVHLTERLIEMALKDPEKASMLLQFVSDDPQKLTTHLLAKGCAMQDSFSLACAEEAFQALIAGGLSILHAYNPRCLILGGGLLQGFPNWIPSLEAILKKRALPAAGKHLIVRPALLQTQAGGIGAALYARSM